MSARDVIEEALAAFTHSQDSAAREVTTALHAAGYLIIPPGELEELLRKERERCAEVADQSAAVQNLGATAGMANSDDVDDEGWRDDATYSHGQYVAKSIAAGIRALGGGE